MTDREIFEAEIAGYNNGHDIFMICGVDETDEDRLIACLRKAGVLEMTGEGRYENNTLYFQGHGVRFTNVNSDYDLLRTLTFQFPKARCYWADAWQNQLEFAIRSFSYGSKWDYDYSIRVDSLSDSDEEGYMDIEAVVIDHITGGELPIGGGMIPVAEVRHFLENEAGVSALPCYTSSELYAMMSDRQKDDIYRKVWSEHVFADVMSVLEDYEVSEEEKEQISEQVANDYVYNGRYDCNLSYWDNLNNLIESLLN